MGQVVVWIVLGLFIGVLYVVLVTPNWRSFLFVLAATAGPLGWLYWFIETSWSNAECEMGSCDWLMPFVFVRPYVIYALGILLTAGALKATLMLIRRAEF